MKIPFLNRRLTSFQIIILGFSLVILLGTLLLMVPAATNVGIGASFSDALFTATSAVCVTGLVVRDTAIYWSMFGQFIILLLIQIGGMGVLTIAIAIVRLTGKKIGLMQRSTLQEAISAHHVGGIVKMAGFIVGTSAIIEGAGALLLSIAFVRDYGVVKGIWYGLFHSISAFCNAGFDLMGKTAPFSSLTGYTGRPLVNIVVMLLIIIGGIGFLTWEDLKTNRLNIKSWRMQTKTVITVTAGLIILPALYFYFVEFSGSVWQGMKGGERALASAFQAITPRTAGFNTVDFAGMSETGLFLIMILMLIGGSPGSTAGGMKTTTIAALFGTMFSVFRHNGSVHCFRRRLDEETIFNAITVFMLYVGLFLIGGFVISGAEGLPLIECLFESASAIGTVGLTMGITPQLGTVSRCILIMLMFFGRVGSLTLISAAMPGSRAFQTRYPREKMMVG